MLLFIHWVTYYWTFGYFQSSTITNNAFMTNLMQNSVHIFANAAFRRIHRNRVAGSKRNSHIIFLDYNKFPSIIVLFCITAFNVGRCLFLYSFTNRICCRTLRYLINIGEKWCFSEVLISLSLIMWYWVSFHMFKSRFHFLFCELAISFDGSSIRLSFFPSIFQRPLCSCDISTLSVI